MNSQTNIDIKNNLKNDFTQEELNTKYNNENQLIQLEKEKREIVQKHEKQMEELEKKIKKI